MTWEQQLPGDVQVTRDLVYASVDGRELALDLHCIPTLARLSH